MIDFLFTLDYEVYGNGTGSLRELVYEPGEELRRVFRSHGAKFVNFTEVAEFEMLAAERNDEGIEVVEQQIRDLYKDGHEIALHLHPQWYNARYESGRWALDYAEYNLCTLTPQRIAGIVDRALAYLRKVLAKPEFTPLSFRAGNWLFQPTKNAAAILSDRGIRIDSSVFKGGVQHNHNLDYRRAMRNGYFWRFTDDANVPDPTGPWLEVPIHSEMVPPWRMATSKRVSYSGNLGIAGQSLRRKINRVRDLMRVRYPLKLDFCRMTLQELTDMTEKVVKLDEREPHVYRPLVAIGHTKDLTDFETVNAFLGYLRDKKINVCTFDTVLAKTTSVAESVAAS